jgi:esterase/lipase superfamily enzyme
VEADRLSKEDEVQRLKAIHAAVAEELESARRLESAASYGYTKANLPLSLARLAAKIIVTATTENQRARNFVNQVFDTDAHKKPPYGTVMVCVGPKGMPDGVRVVSISELARESNRPESETIQELRKSSYLLFDQEAFSRLINKLVIDMREGRLHLPIPVETLARAETLRLETRKAEWVRCPRPQ